MSLFGKILVLLNLLGAVGLVVFVGKDFSLREYWAKEYVLTQFRLNGLPLDDKELGETVAPSAGRIEDADYARLFGPNAGKPVNTQNEAFTDVKNKVAEYVTKAGSDADEEQKRVAQTLVLARAMLPLTDAFHEREQLLAARANFITPEAYRLFKDRCGRAVQEAMKPGRPDLPGRAFSQAFRAFLHAQGGVPADGFATLLLEKYRDVPPAKVVFDQAFLAAVEDQRVAFETMFKNLVEEAVNKAPDPATKKAAVARVLYGVAPFLAEEAIKEAGSPEDQALLAVKGGPLSAEYHKRLVLTKAYRDQVERMLVVCGLRATLTAISDRTAGLRRLIDYSQNSVAQKRQQFVNDHNFVIGLIREQAGLVKDEALLKVENQERFTGYETVAKERTEEINQLKEEYKQLRAKTAEEVAKLREKSQQVFDLRLRVRNEIEATEKGEERIRALERRILELDGK